MITRCALAVTRARTSSGAWTTRTATVGARRVSRKATSAMVNADADRGYAFGPIVIPRTQVFYETPSTFALVNLKPVVRGHVLVCPRRVVAKFTDLTSDEISDLWRSVARVQRQIERMHDTTSSTLAIQDGPLAGQSVPHVHVHVLPRREGDFERNDDVYDALEGRASKALDNDAREPRTAEEMRIEADAFRALFVDE